MKKMKKQLLTIILLCVLTLTGFTALTSMKVNAAASDVDILSYSWYVAPNNYMASYQGDLVCVGEIQNVGTTTLLDVTLIGTAYINDTPVASASRQVFANNIEPGQKAPFYLDFVPENSVTGDQSWVANVTSVVVTSGYAENADKNMYQGLTVSSDNSTASGTYRVIGAVQNIGNETVGDIRVVTTFYNANGTVVSLNYTEVLSDALAPGSSVSFTATPVDNYPADNITNYATLIQSTVQLPDTTSTPAPSSTETPTATPTSTATATPTQTPEPDSQDYTLLIVTAAIVVVIVLAVAVLLTRKNRKKPESAP
jgi:hypothetical protein